MRIPAHSRRHPSESGFAVLLVFAMAAMIAILLYMELPRVAFEAQRNKEELLIERGHEYQRAIQLYFRKLKKYPGSIEQLEDTNNIRFLRRRYVDPISGKAEWRLIHIGANGVFTDSITQKAKQGQDKKSDPNTFITEGGGVGASLSQSQRASGQPPRRASEQIPPSDPNNPNNMPPGDVAGSQPAANPGQPVPGMPGGYSSGVGSQLPIPGAGNQAPVSALNQQGGINNPFGGGMPSNGANPGAGMQGGFNPGQPSANPAADLIGNLLRTPRNAAPGAGLDSGSGLGTGSALGAGSGMNQSMGGGIAGVASTVERLGIKIYNDRDKYNEWEFIYDFGKDRTGMGRMAEQLGNGDPRLAGGAQGGQSGFGNAGGFGQGGVNPGGMPGQAGFGSQTGFAGNQSGFGSQGGFGGQQGTPGFGQSAQPSSGGVGSGSGGVGSGYGSGVGSGYSAPATAQPAQPQPGARQPGQRQPLQPGPIPAIPGLPPPQPAPTPPALVQDPQSPLPAPVQPPAQPPQQ